MICVELGRALKVPKSQSELFARALLTFEVPFMMESNGDHNKFHWPAKIRVDEIKRKGMEMCEQYL